MTEPQEESLAELETRLIGYDGPDKIVSSREMREIIKARVANRVRFHSKLGALEGLVDGFEGGELVVISGPTKNGKTLFAQTLSVHFAEQKVASLWFTFEVPVPQFLKQMPETIEFFMPRELRPYNTDWLEERIVEAKLKQNVRAIFIDHLHYLIDIFKGGKNLSVDIGAIVRKIKRAAVKHNIVIFLLCHATKAQDATGQTRELTAFDTRDSSFIPQEADTTFIIQRRQDKETGEYNQRAMLKVCNHRRTGVMEKRITLVKEGALFKDVMEVGGDQAAYSAWQKEQALSGSREEEALPF